MSELRVGFIGAGRMATALAQGLLRQRLVTPENLLASDVSSEALGQFAETTGGTKASDNLAVARGAQVLFLAVKPQQLAAACAELRTALSAEHLVISIAAGIRLEKLAEWCGASTRVVRVMPNTPCLVGQSASAYCPGPACRAEDGALVQKLLGAVGVVHAVDEKLLDAVTGLSGSGPAFVYVFIEALSDGGVRMGLPRAVATELAAQTVLGAAQMVLTTGQHPGELKDQVASPGGTTIAGLHALESHGFRGGLISAVEAAARRSEELGKG